MYIRPMLLSLMLILTLTPSIVFSEVKLKTFKFSLTDLPTDELIKSARNTSYNNIPSKNKIKSKKLRTRSVKANSTGNNIFQIILPSVVKVLTKGGLGSGVIISTSSESNRSEIQILTNHHVVAGARRVGIQLADDKSGENILLGTVVMFDEIADLALITFYNDERNFIPITFARDEIYIGEDVHAMGHPLGQDWTYTRGYVSQIRVNYAWSTGLLQHFVADVIQTQTPINPGNSGGPLVNSAGELVGINTLGKTAAEGINFAIALSSIEVFRNGGGNVIRPEQMEIHSTILGKMVRSIDKNKNGNPDHYFFDTIPENKIADSFCVDSNEDLTCEEMRFDRNENKIVELKIFEGTYKNKKAIIYHYDKNEDGVFESIGIDFDLDGKPDFLRPLS